MANVTKCPLIIDKRKIEYPALPQTEFSEVVLNINNSSTKDLIVELVPPPTLLSGIQVNPLVKTLIAGKGGLFSIKYHSKFRDLTHATLDEWINPKKNEDQLAPGMVLANKKLAARILEKKNQ